MPAGATSSTNELPMPVPSETTASNNTVPLTVVTTGSNW